MKRLTLRGDPEVLSLVQQLAQLLAPPGSGVLTNDPWRAFLLGALVQVLASSHGAGHSSAKPERRRGRPTKKLQPMHPVLDPVSCRQVANILTGCFRALAPSDIAAAEGVLGERSTEAATAVPQDDAPVLADKGGAHMAGGRAASLNPNDEKALSSGESIVDRRGQGLLFADPIIDNSKISTPISNRLLPKMAGTPPAAKVWRRSA